MGNPQIHYYDVHGLVTLAVQEASPRGSRWAGLGRTLAHFEVPSLEEEPDIWLKVGDFEPHYEDDCLVDHQVHVRPNYIFCQDQWRNLRWQVEIEGFESGPTRVRLALRGGGLRQALVPGLFAEALFTRQIMGRHLQRQGCTLLHAAGAGRGGGALVAFGRGGAFKTTVMMSLLRSSPEWRLLGDDSVIWQNGQVWSFPTYPALFDYRLRKLPTEDMRGQERAGLLLSQWRPKKPLVVYTDQARAAAIVEMRTGAFEKLEISPVPVEDNLAAMFRTAQVEDHNSVNLGLNDAYLRYVEAYSYIFPGNALQARACLSENNGQACSGLASYRVCLPLSPSTPDIEAVTRFFNQLGAA